MAAKKRVVKSFEKIRRYENDPTIVDTFRDEIRDPDRWKAGGSGLPSEVSLGKAELEKLGFPQRIRVVIYNIDD